MIPLISFTLIDFELYYIETLNRSLLEKYSLFTPHDESLYFLAPHSLDMNSNRKKNAQQLSY